MSAGFFFYALLWDLTCVSLIGVSVSVCMCVWSPCLHLFWCAEFIVWEHLFDKGLGGFEMNLVSLSFSVPCLISEQKLKMKIRKSRVTSERMCLDCLWAQHLPVDLPADLFMAQSDPVTIQIQRWCCRNPSNIYLSLGDRILTRSDPGALWHVVPLLSFSSSYRPPLQFCHIEMKASHLRDLSKFKKICSWPLSHTFRITSLF